MQWDRTRQAMRRATLGVALAAGIVAAGVFQLQAAAQEPTPVRSSAGALSAGLVPAERLEKLLPPSVFFQDQSAPLQLRNAAAIHTAGGNTIWAALVDNSGYSTGVRERYQFYFVTESAITLGGKPVPAGAYGGGFLSGGTLLLMDIGGHDFLRVPVTDDPALRRPRPLQMVADPAGARLYVGRQYVTIAAQ